MISSFEDPVVSVETPAPFRDERGIRWYPLRSIAEALGYEVVYSISSSNGGEVVHGIELSAQDTQIHVDIPDGATWGRFTLCDGARELPVTFSDGHFFVTPECFEAFFNLTYFCYNETTLFALITE